MECGKCIWGRVVSDIKYDTGRKTTIMCSRIHCPQMAIANAEEQGKRAIAMMTKPLIYVCSPLKGDVRTNLTCASRYCRFVAQCHAIPVAPHLYFTRFLDDEVENERELGMDMGLDALTYCSSIWVFGETISTGMQAELDLARELKIPIYFFDSTCKPTHEPIAEERT